MGRVIEKDQGGSSNESLENNDPALRQKMEKDQINQVKKKEALKKASSNEENEKVPLAKVSSHPEPIMVSVEVHGSPEDEETEDSSEGDTENEEITIKKKAIAEAELEVINLQKEIKETELNFESDLDTRDYGENGQDVCLETDCRQDVLHPDRPECVRRAGRVG